ncbi:MAG: hypothetical protein IJE23_07540 [Tyzzerella sp.]|nr:hypothetical protein [Tyzzerella sp.]
MKQLRKRIVAVICLVAMLGGIVFQNGFSLDAKAADTTSATREWYVYGDDAADTGLVVTDATNGVTSGSISDAGVNLPEGLTEANMELQINLTVSGDPSALNGSGATIELANVRSDCGELSWSYNTLVTGENNVSFAFKDASHTNGSVVNGNAVQDDKTPFDWEETINFFRFYQTSVTSGSLKITVNEIKIVYTDAGLVFGDNDTYLQLDNAMSTTPGSVEATVNMPSTLVEGTKWILRPGSDTNASHSMTTGVTAAGEEPGAGMTYSVLDATNGAISSFSTTHNTNLGIDASAYTMDNLAVAFWVWSNSPGTLGTGDHMRISSNVDNVSGNCLFYYYNNVSLASGWNYVVLPLDEWEDDIKGQFSLSNINSFGFTAYNLAAGQIRYFGDFELVVLEEQSGWMLRSGDKTTTTSGHTMTVGTTGENDASGAGMKYSILNGAVDNFGTLDSGYGIDASAYEMDELAVAFWVWSNSAGTLGSGDHLRISSNVDNVSSNCLFYYYNNVSLTAGWNYVVLPLDKWEDDIKGDFSLSNINSFGFTAYDLAADQTRYFGDIKLIVLDKSDWELRSGASTKTSSGHVLKTGVTKAGEAPGEGMIYSIVDASSSGISGFGTLDSGLAIDASAYEMDELAVAFWVWSNSTGTLGSGDHLRISSNVGNVSGNCLFYYYNNVSLTAGWNYVVLPLDKWEDDIKGDFSLSNINSFGFTSYTLPAGQIRYFGNFELIVIEPATEWTLRTGADTTGSNYAVTTGTTTSSDAPGAGMVYNILNASNSAISGFSTLNNGFGIDASAYTMDQLAVTFWVWANEAGTLGTGDQLRIGSDNYLSSNALIYYYKDIPVEAGWNYIELPLSEWGDDIKEQFTLNNINCFGFTSYSLAAGQIRYVGDFKLVALTDGGSWTMTDTSSTYNNNYGLSYTPGSVTGTESQPAVGTTYVKTEVPAYDASVANSGKFGFELRETMSFDASSNPSNYAVAFWFYSSTGLMPVGQIELTSANTNDDNNEIRWEPQNLSIQKGWNYVVLNIAQPQGSAGSVETSSINYMRWYTDTNYSPLAQDTVYAIADINLIQVDTNEVVQTLCEAENIPLGLGFTLEKTTCTMQQGPSTGTAYMETTVPGYTGEQAVYKSCFGFYTTYGPIDASEYEASNLIVSLWVYTATGKLPSGQIEINSSGKANDGAELVWFPQNFNSQLNIGWNKLELNLGKPHHTGGSGIDLSNINFIRWYTDESESVVCQSDTMFRLGQITLYVDSIDEGSIEVTQNVSSTSGNYMIFSNANAKGENSPFAMFVTEKGYLGVLYGATQFVLKQNVCTGEDVKVKVARNALGRIVFYINDEVVATSETKVSALGAPTTAYSIGADGIGGQTFNGTIKDVKAFSDATATKCAGNWPLVGDSMYVVETMSDISENGNDAHFKGSRADDWYDVETIAKDEWSLVFIPDMIQRFYADEASMWYKMSEWIGSNVQNENIKYVIGDRLADQSPNQLVRNANGFERFDNRVASSNLNNSANGYYRFQVNGVKWLVLTLEQGYDGDSFIWAKEVLAQHSYDNVIITCNEYYDSVWTELGSYNVKLILAGKQGNEASADSPFMLMAADDTENTYFNGEQGLGLLYVLRFSNNGTEVTARSYAPVYGKYFTNAVNYTKTINVVEAPKTMYSELTNAVAGTEPDNVPEGYLFAGWFTEVDTDLETDADGNGEYDDSVALVAGTSGSAYAKFVDKDMLSVKGQVKAETTDESNYSDIRFVTSVDRLNYKKIGLKISYAKDDGSIKNLDKASNTVYERLYAVGANGGQAQPYKPSQVTAASATYFKAYTVTNVPNRAFDREFTVQAYWITMDGTTVYGEQVTKTVRMGYPTNGENLPKIVTTKYATEDVVVAEIVPTEEKYGYTIDNTGAVDCTAELQRALDDCHAMGGGTVYLPAGTYRIDGRLTIPSHVTLRGDWQDPDKGTEYGTVLNIRTSEITANRNADATHKATATITMSGSSGVVGITVYYPEQNLSDVQTYPYTFYLPDSNCQLVTLKNITVLNGYRGIGTSYENQHEAIVVDGFKGTFLDCGMALYNASDTGRITGVSISSKYWKNKDGVDASSYVKSNATAMELGDLEWEQFSNCSIDGYNVGISVVGGYRINFSGTMIDMDITGCTTGITIADENDATYYAGSGVKYKDTWPLIKAMDARWGTVLARSTVEGKIENHTTPTTNWLQQITQKSALLRLTDVEFTESQVSDQNYTGGLLNYNKNVQWDTADLSSYDAQYDASYTKPVENLWVVEGIKAYDGANVDVSELIEEEIVKLLERNESGGIIYIPGGTYRLDNQIHVPAGVELRGVSAVANREKYDNCEGTLFMCYYGDDASSSQAAADALITLDGDGAGVNGIRFIYPENIITYDENTNSTYTIAANGASNVHVVNCFIITSSYGVNLTNCENFFIEGIYSACYLNTFNISGGSGILRGCLANPNMVARTSAVGLTANWPKEAAWEEGTADYNKIRDGLRNNLKYITVSNSADVLVQDIIAYAVNDLVTVSDSNTSVLVINSNADHISNEGHQFVLNNGSLVAINAMRAVIAQDSSADSGAVESEAAAYQHNSGTFKIYNSIYVERDNADSVYEANYEATK